ncbi:MAG: hypothetical protein JST01_26020 [Cyanobacteria bacterium SZAS TMP-1]|nr:hypothetical protein [Cyanobacteria bacterium SZAS TMP-1]
MAQGPDDNETKPDQGSDDSSQGKKKRKVPKTMIFGVDDPKDAPATENPAPASAEAPKQEQAPTGEKKRKVPKTLLFDTTAAMEAAVMQAAVDVDKENAENAKNAQAAETTAPAQPTADESGKKRKVPKTLLFDTTDLKEKAAAMEAAAEPAAQPTSAAPPEPAQPGRKVAKTMLYDTSNLQAQTPDKDPDAPPELNIDGPEVRLFFEEPAPAEKPKRRVPKTLLFNPVIGADGQEQESTSTGAQNDAGVRKISTRKIAKTLLYNKPLTADQIVAASNAAEPPLDVKEAEKVVERYIARTMLDHSILFDQLTKSQHHLQEKAEEAAKERANEPFKPFFPIVCKKNALPCAYTWDPTYSNEKYRYCDKCQRPVYNFAGLEMADAEAIVLKAENRSKFTLFKRTDGLFMTSDCPVAVKKRSDLILMTVGGFLLAVSLVLYMMMLPKPKPAPAPVATVTKPVKTSGIKMPKTSSGSGKSGQYGHYVAGQGVIMDKPAAQPTPPPVLPPPVQGPDEEEQIWEFPNGRH